MKHECSLFYNILGFLFFPSTGSHVTQNNTFKIWKKNKKNKQQKTLFFFDNPSLFCFWDTQSEEHLCFWDFRTSFYSIFVEYFVQVFFANLNSPRKEEGNFLFGRNFCHAKLTTKPSSYWKEKEYLWTAFLDLPRNSLTAQNITKKNIRQLLPNDNLFS